MFKFEFYKKWLSDKILDNHFNFRIEMYYTYVLRSLRDRKFYIGFTNNLERRFYQHQKGKCQATKNRVPFEIVYYEKFDNRV